MSEPRSRKKKSTLIDRLDASGLLDDKEDDDSPTRRRKCLDPDKSSSSSEDTASDSDSNSETEAENSPSEHDQDDEEEDQNNLYRSPLASPAQIQTPPPTVPQKRKRGRKPKGSFYFLTCIYRCSASTEPTQDRLKTITYILAIFAASELSKPSSKRVARSASIQLQTDEPWSTIEAQMLVKVSEALNPTYLDFKNYDATFYIPRVLPKPGMALTNNTDYGFLLQRANKMKGEDLIMNIIITERGNPSAVEKENMLEDVEGRKKKKKEVCDASSPVHDRAHFLLERGGDSARECHEKYAYRSFMAAMAMYQTQTDLHRISLLCQSRDRRTYSSEPRKI
jgi:hypothetical protein